MSMLEDLSGGPMESGGWPPAQGSYTLKDRLREFLEYLTSRSRRLTLKYYDSIVSYAVNRNESLSGIPKKKYLRKDWKGIAKYPDLWAIEEIFKVPFQDLPLHISYPLEDGIRDYCDPLKELTAQWRLENGI